MAERGSRQPATDVSANFNADTIYQELYGPGHPVPAFGQMLDTTQALRQELAEKGLKGFKRGGKVKRTGVYRLHKGERVVRASVARKGTATRRTATTRRAAAVRSARKLTAKDQSRRRRK